MANQPPPKGFWASIADTLGIGLSPAERKKRSEDFARDVAGLLIGGSVLQDLDKQLSPQERAELANMFLDPSVNLEQKLAELKQERDQMREQERKAREPVSPAEEYRREVERESQQHFGRKAAYQAEGQRLIAEFMSNRAAGLSADEIRREIQNINDWVQRKIDEL